MEGNTPHGALTSGQCEARSAKRGSEEGVSETETLSGPLGLWARGFVVCDACLSRPACSALCAVRCSSLGAQRRLPEPERGPTSLDAAEDEIRHSACYVTTTMTMTLTAQQLSSVCALQVARSQPTGGAGVKGKGYRSREACGGLDRWSLVRDVVDQSGRNSAEIWESGEQEKRARAWQGAGCVCAWVV